MHLNINVSPPLAGSAYDEAVKAVNKEVSIPGFRSGKAPLTLIKQRFDKQIKSEWHNVLLNRAFSEFLESTGLYPFQNERSVKKAEIKSISKENGAELVIEYEMAPEVPDVDYSSLSLVPVDRQPVTEENVDHALHEIQLHYCQWEPITDRSVQEGDFVDLDIEALENPPRSISQDMRFEVSPKEMGAWMRKLIIGKSANETVEGVSEKDESLKDLSGSEFIPTHCRITIKEIWKSELPALDDDLASKVGVSNIEELKTRIRKNLENQSDQEQKNKLRAQIENRVLEKYPFDIPASLIEVQRKEIVAQRLAQLKKHEHSQEKLSEMTKAIEENVLDELVRAYRLYFLVHKIAKNENINVYENEVYREGLRQAAEGNSYLLNNLENEEIRSKLYVNILTRKVLDFVVEKLSG